MGSKLKPGDKIVCPYCNGEARQPSRLNTVGYVGEPRRCPNCVNGIATVGGFF